MSLDPNWFYSSLCQCAAALVGLIGAILTARIQSQITSSTETRNAVQKSLTNLRTSIAGTLGQLNSYDAWVRERIHEVDSALKKKATVIHIKEDRTFWGGSSSSGSTYPKQISQELLKEYKDNQSHLSIIKEKIEPHSKLFSYEHAVKLDEGIKSLKTLLPENVYNQIANTTIPLPLLEEHLKDHLKVSSIRLPLIMTVILFWLSIFGLIVPLCYLSAHDGFSKHWLLVSFSIGILAIPIYLVIELLRIYRLREAKIKV